MTDELENQLRALGSAMNGQLDEATVRAKREMAVQSAMRARRTTPERRGFEEWLALFLSPKFFAPAAALSVVLLGAIFVVDGTRESGSVVAPATQLASSEDIEDELADEVSLVGASFVKEVEAEFESEGEGEIDDTFVSLSFSEDDFDTEEDFSSEDGTETI